MSTTVAATTQAVATAEPLLLRSDAGGIATLTLNRPKHYNALSQELLTELQSALDAIERDASVRVVVIAGNGPAFCAGHDLKQMRATPRKEYYEALFAQCSRFMLTLARIPQPVIARVHGIATAAGCQLVAACDLAVASEAAKFATSGINVGLFCSTPAVPVSRNVARKPAMEMLLTGEFIDAQTAKSYGLVNRVVSADRLDAEVSALAGAIIAKSPVAVATGKRMFYEQIEMGMKEAYDYAAEVMACNMMAEDVGEGIDAFMQKRPPVWKGR
ncbi:MAG TPA: enoyl-CoA hydratase [Burkholderiales bacterium]|jgi:enoyl-CoA hydratase/carnithine racemase|nr:enoyl-CoA hydratase [Burkholderiales bacterium]